jgi:DNA invertase Pin-like site-specific DNA recombinase
MFHNIQVKVLGHFMLIGYARVSTQDQNSELQHDALIQAGVDERHIFMDIVSGSTLDRPQLKNVLEYLKAGDVLVVWKLDRLGRSLHELIRLMQELSDKGIGFRSLTEMIDTTTPGGKMVFHVFGAMAQFERDLISERTKAGLEAAKQRGRRGGRPVSLTQEQKDLALSMIAQEKPIALIARTLKVSRQTIYRVLNKF